MAANLTSDEAFNDLSFYTLMHPSPEFIHQRAVDAYAAQNASDLDKPIRSVFAVAGLYLHVERGFDGREVQRAHMKMARQKQDWPRLDLPSPRGNIKVFDVIAAEPGEERDRVIYAWCRDVFEAFRPQIGAVVQLLVQNQIIPSE